MTMRSAWNAYKDGWAKSGVDVSNKEHAFLHGFMAAAYKTPENEKALGGDVVERVADAMMNNIWWQKGCPMLYKDEKYKGLNRYCDIDITNLAKAAILAMGGVHGKLESPPVDYAHKDCNLAPPASDTVIHEAKDGARCPSASHADDASTANRESGDLATQERCKGCGHWHHKDNAKLHASCFTPDLSASHD